MKTKCEGCNHTEETKAKMKGQKRTEETKRKMREAWLRRKEKNNDYTN